MLKTIFTAVSLVVVLGFYLVVYAQEPDLQTLEKLKAFKEKSAEMAFHAPPPEQLRNPQIEKAIETLKEKTGLGWKIQWNDAQTAIETIRGTIPLAKPSKISDSPDKIAVDFLKENYGLFQMRPDLADLHIDRSIEGMDSYDVTLRQTYNDLPVFNGQVKISIGVKQKDIRLLHNYYVPDINISVTPVLSEDRVIAIAHNDVFKNHMYEFDKHGNKPYFGKVIFSKKPKLKLGIYNFHETTILVFKFTLDIKKPFNSLSYMIDANTGEIIDSRVAMIVD